ncbi:MAG: LolA family protein [Alphaproteobacteria bacterium]
MLFGICAKLASLAVVLMVAAAPAQSAAALSSDQKAAVAEVSAYLNGIRSFEARFLQVSQNGGIAEGKLYIQRPGRMRLEYKPPVPLLVVSTGKLLILYDRNLDQVTHLPLSASPAAFLLADKIRFDGRVRVIAVKRVKGRIYVSVAEKGRPDKGSLHLMFVTKPLKLREWIVVDAQRRRTKVVLLDIRRRVKLDPKLFLLERTGKGGQSGYR